MRGLLDAVREKRDRDNVDALYSKEIKAEKQQLIFENIIRIGILLVLLITFLFSVWAYTHPSPTNTHTQCEKVRILL